MNAVFNFFATIHSDRQCLVWFALFTRLFTQAIFNRLLKPSASIYMIYERLMACFILIGIYWSEVKVFWVVDLRLDSFMFHGSFVIM